jgi:hypothetical protein
MGSGSLVTTGGAKKLKLKVKMPVRGSSGGGAGGAAAAGGGGQVAAGQEQQQGEGREHEGPAAKKQRSK